MPYPAYFQDQSLKTSGIYSIECAASGKLYIGSSINMFHRWRGHYAHLRIGDHHCSHLQRSWEKHGRDAFVFRVLELCNRLVLRSREQDWIDATPEEIRINAAPTAGSLLGFKMDPSTVDKRRRAHLGLKHSEQTKALISSLKKGVNPRPPGWKMIEEGKRKLSEVRKGKPLSPEHAAKCAQQLSKFRVKTPELLLAMAHGGRRFNDNDVGVVRSLYSQGKSAREIAEIFSSNIVTVMAAVRGRGIYSHVGTGIKGIPTRVVSEETRQKQSKASKGRKQSEATKKLRNSINTGKKRSEESKARMRIAQRARYAKD